VETGWLAPKPKAPLRRLVNARALDLKSVIRPRAIHVGRVKVSAS